MTSTTNPETISGERIEELQQMAGDHMFMHAAQINDWRGNLKVYVKGDGVWVETLDGQRHLDAMAGLWYKSVGYGRTDQPGEHGTVDCSRAFRRGQGV